MHKILGLIGALVVISAVIVGILLLTGKSSLPFVSNNQLPNTSQSTSQTEFDKLGIKFKYPSEYKVSIQSSLAGRQNTFVFASSQNTFRLIVLTNKNDIELTEDSSAGEKYMGWTPTKVSLLKKFCETEVCTGTTSLGYYIAKPNFIYDLTYEDPALKTALLKIIDTVSIDDAYSLNLFVLPDGIYSFEYPVSWDLLAQKPTNSRYYAVEVRSSNYKTDANASSGYEKLILGSSTYITVKDTNEKDIRAFFNSSQMLSVITKNIKESDVNSLHLLEYDYSFEDTTATMTEFITKERMYNFRFKYASDTDKMSDQEAYYALIKSIKFLEK